MRDPTSEFFEGLRRRGHERLLEEAEGTMLFSIERDHRTDHWFLEIKNGDVYVSRGERPADCIVRTNKALFDRMTTGETNLQQAWLRNEVLVEGDLMFLRRIDRVWPGPRGASHPRAAVSKAVGRP